VVPGAVQLLVPSGFEQHGVPGPPQVPQTPLAQVPSRGLHELPLLTHWPSAQQALPVQVFPAQHALPTAPQGLPPVPVAVPPVAGAVPPEPALPPPVPVAVPPVPGAFPPAPVVVPPVPGAFASTPVATPSVPGKPLLPPLEASVDA
jgi:hypothetical protein